MVVNAKLLLDQLRDPLQGPQVGPMASSHGASHQQFGQSPFLRLPQLGRPAWGRVGTQPHSPLPLVGLVPSVHRAFGGAQSPGYGRQGVPSFQQADGLSATPLQLLGGALGSHSPQYTEAGQSVPLFIRNSIEPISKLLQEHGDAGELHKAQEVGGIVLPTNEESPLPLQPSKEAFDEPAPFIRAEVAAILGLEFLSRAMRKLHREPWAAQHVAYFSGIRFFWSRPPLVVGT